MKNKKVAIGIVFAVLVLGLAPLNPLLAFMVAVVGVIAFLKL